MRHSHFFKESRMMQIAIGFIIAALVGLTGIGGGSFTTPALMLLVGLPATEAVGTAMVFSAVVRLIAAPFYVLGRNVKVKYLSLLLVGAIPGLLAGIYILRRLGSRASNPVLLISLGTILAWIIREGAGVGCCWAVLADRRAVSGMADLPCRWWQRFRRQQDCESAGFGQARPLAGKCFAMLSLAAEFIALRAPSARATRRKTGK